MLSIFPNSKNLLKMGLQLQAMELSQSKGSSVAYSNYQYAFLYFNGKFVDLCLSLSSTLSLRFVRRKVSTFMYEFSYAIPNANSWEYYKKELESINTSVQQDRQLEEIREKESLSFREEVSAYPFYYKHYMSYLNLLANYVAELTATYLPRTNYQETLLSFRNDSPFYDKLHEYKRQVYDQLSEFSLIDFRIKFNSFITFYHAYLLFINKTFAKRIDSILKGVLDLFLSEEIINILARYPDLSREDIKTIFEVEAEMHEAVLYCNALVNASLSNYGVLPKLRKKVYFDKTLI